MENPTYPLTSFTFTLIPSDVSADKNISHVIKTGGFGFEHETRSVQIKLKPRQMTGEAECEPAARLAPKL